MSTYLRKDRIISKYLTSEAYKFLVEKYGRSNVQQLTPASPFIQLLSVLGEISELNFLYIENAISELNIATAKNLENVYGLARLTGHNPSRGMSSKGKVTLRLKTNHDDFNGNYFLIPKYTKLLSLNNNLNYMLVPETDNLKIEKNNISSIECNIIEGEIETQTFISTGESLQSFSVMIAGLTDHYNINVTVNGETYMKYDSLYDMGYNEKGVIIKTGINGGLDMYFGNDSFGFIPVKGSKIAITYIKSHGVIGNIATQNTKVYFKFDSLVYDIYGDELDLNDLCDVNVTMNPTFGSNEESIDFTRMIAPYMSRNFVLVSPSNYYYFFKKFNFFSIINVYNTVDDIHTEDDNIVYAFLVPDVRKKITSDFDYFNLNTTEFLLTTNEKNLILRLINESGQQLIGSEIKFVEPLIKKYVLNIVLTYYKNITKESIIIDIRKRLNEYFINVNRRDIIPRADIIAILKNIEGIDSVNVFFISEENETAIINGYYTKQIFDYNTTTQKREWRESKKITLNANEDPNLGLNEFGDILIDKSDIPVIKGGWKDRNNLLYDTDPLANFSGLNIFFKDPIEYSLYTQENINLFKSINK